MSPAAADAYAAEIHAVTDRLLLEHGEFDPFEFLLRRGWLDYADFSAWQRGAPVSLQAVLQTPVDTAIAALERAQRYARAQGLQLERRPAGGGEIGRDPHFALLCSSLLKRPGDRPQGDLFQDSAALFTLDALRAALARHDHAAIAALLSRLQREAPREVPGYAALHAAIDGDPAQTAAQRRLQIEQQLAPAAQRLLGPAARGYLAPLWIALAQRLTRESPDADDLQLHPSHAWMAAGHWRDAAASITASSRDWTRAPALITRLALIQARQHRLAESRRLRMRLCWQFPDAASAMFDRLGADDPDSALLRRWPEFQRAEPALPVSRFPAWLLLADPRQRDWLPPDQPPVTLASDDDQACYRALHRLLGAPDDLDARRALKAAQPELLQAFLGLRARGAV
ncbi:MAG: hypothetical protein C0434_11590 [Xanthomonadaceae bacterium]|nr:hypothetical protein [Xanthomonadaceae bacterium]